MARTKATLLSAIQHRLGDTVGTVWTRAQIAMFLDRAYRELAQAMGVFVDWTYLENLPAGFSCTAAWEVDYETFTCGIANYTYSDERRLLTEADRIGPANHTMPAEATEGHLADAGASTAIPATAELPATVTGIQRVVWDRRTCAALLPAQLARTDVRYETTTGAMVGYLWRKDGIRTLRKYKVPSAVATTYTIGGAWGALRGPTDLDAGTVSGTWGVPRQLEGQHPLGDTGGWGLPRRPYADGMNVRVEHTRLGRAVSEEYDTYELPDRYVDYLRDRAIGQCLALEGPGQDRRLAVHYDARWQRDLARIHRRLRVMDRGRVNRFGGASVSTGRPAGPRYPSSYGSVVR